MVFKLNINREFFLQIFFVWIAFGFAVTGFAQTDATAKLDTNAIKIGDQIHMDLTFKYKGGKGTTVVWPEFKDSLISKIEIVNKSKVDTIKDVASDTYILKQRLTITSFDSGYYAIPPVTFNYQVNNDTAHHKAETEALLLTVRTIPVDTTQAIKEIKEPLEVPFAWEEALPYIIGGVAIIAVAILVYWLIRKYRKKGKEEVIPAIPARPAHEIALEELALIEKEKLWQQGLIKQYHSRLADAVRQYIEYRYDIRAMELPTDETLAVMNKRISDPMIREKLKQLLVLADLVKFAKNQPIAMENELSMKNAYEFIYATKPATEENKDRKEEVKQ